MRPRFTLGLVLTLAVAVVVGGAVFGFFGVSFYQTTSTRLIGLLAGGMGMALAAAANIVLFGAVAGVLGWLALFGLRRDGLHRLEWVALTPKNYGGRSPFDLSPRK